MSGNPLTLSGRTDVLSLFDLAQVLSVNEATGMLRVETNETKGYLYFQAGAIINAIDGENPEGEEAAKNVFGLRDAEFEFATDLPSVAHRISVTTQNLMMDIARQLDEEMEGQDGGEEIGEHLREVQQATESLNRIFHQIDSDSRIYAHRSHQGFRVMDMLAAIRESTESVLFLRSGAPPEVRAGDRVIPLSEVSLDRESYEGMRDHLMREATRTHESEDPREGCWILSLAEDGFYRLEIVGAGDSEILTLRRLRDPATLPSALPWPAERLDDLLGEPGSIVLLVTPDAGTREAAFEAVCAYFLEIGAGPFLGVARRWPPTLGTGRASATLLSTMRLGDTERIPDLVEALAPSLVAVQDTDRRDSFLAALRAVPRGARAVLGLTSPSPGFAPHRLLAGLEAAERSYVVHVLGLGLRGIVAVDSSGAPRVLEVSNSTRGALLAGDMTELVKALK